MSKLSDIKFFIDACDKIDSPSGLNSLLSDVSREMGFEHFALMHHVDLSPASKELNHMETGQLIALSDYPDSWIEHFIQSNLMAFDPIVIASQKTNVGFAWDEIGGLIELSSVQSDILTQSKKAGLSAGFTVPANVPGESNGSISFAVSSNKAIPTESFPMAQLVGSFGFQAARKIVANSAGHIEKNSKLTQRQLECLIFVAKGKTDWEIGQILGISDQTVKQHITDARGRYNVSKRVQAVLRAVFEGQIPLSEVLK